MAKNALITGWGFYAPSRVMTNAELERIVDTSDEWIVSRTGIKERRIASDEETNSFMSASSGARRAREGAPPCPGRAARDRRHVLAGLPLSGDRLSRADGARRHKGRCVRRRGCLHELHHRARGRARMIVSGAIQNALVIGAERLSRLLNWKDRTTCVLFGDGAGAVVLEASNASVGIESTVLHGDGSKGEMLMVQAGGSSGRRRPTRSNGDSISSRCQEARSSSSR